MDYERNPNPKRGFAMVLFDLMPKQDVKQVLSSVARESNCDVTILSYLEGAGHAVQSMGGVHSFRRESGDPIEEFFMANKLTVPETFDPPIEDVFKRWGRKSYPSGFTPKIQNDLSESDRRFLSACRQKGVFIVALGGENLTRHGAVCLVRVATENKPAPEPMSFQQFVAGRIAVQSAFSSLLDKEPAHHRFLEALDVAAQWRSIESIEACRDYVAACFGALGLRLDELKVEPKADVGVRNPDDFLLAEEEVFLEYIRFADSAANRTFASSFRVGNSSLTMRVSSGSKLNDIELTLVDAMTNLIWWRTALVAATGRIRLK